MPPPGPPMPPPAPPSPPPVGPPASGKRTSSSFFRGGSTLLSSSLGYFTGPWNNPAGGSFNVPTNWQLGVVPGPADSAYFGLGAFTYLVNFPTNVSNIQLTINQNNVTYDLLGHQYQLTGIGSDLATAPIRIGAQVTDNAFLRVTDGTLSGNTTLVGWVSGSEDNLVVSTNAILNSATLDIGHFGRPGDSVARRSNRLTRGPWKRLSGVHCRPFRTAACG